MTRGGRTSASPRARRAGRRSSGAARQRRTHGQQLERALSDRRADALQPRPARRDPHPRPAPRRSRLRRRRGGHGGRVAAASVGVAALTRGVASGPRTLRRSPATAATSAAHRRRRALAEVPGDRAGLELAGDHPVPAGAVAGGAGDRTSMPTQRRAGRAGRPRHAAVHRVTTFQLDDFAGRLRGRSRDEQHRARRRGRLPGRVERHRRHRRRGPRGWPALQRRAAGRRRRRW